MDGPACSDLQSRTVAQSQTPPAVGKGPAYLASGRGQPVISMMKLLLIIHIVPSLAFLNHSLAYNKNK